MVSINPIRSYLPAARFRLVAALILGIGSPVPTFASGGGSDDIGSLFNQFRSLTSLEFKSDVEFTIIEPVPAECWCGPVSIAAAGSNPLAGTFDYWAAGTKYRSNSYLDPSAFAGLQTQVAYNGVRSQILRSDGTLSHSSEDWPTILPTLVNPILELVQFRYPLSDANAQYEVRLRDILMDTVSSSFFNVTWVPVVENGVQLIRATFPGATYDGATYEYHVFAVPSRTNRPVRIDRVTATGRITSTTFEDYVRYDTLSQKAYWPLTITLHAYDPSGNEVVRIRHELTDLAVDESLDHSIFSIDPTMAVRVWDDDKQLFEAIEP